jgi:hypothetical protein
MNRSTGMTEHIFSGPFFMDTWNERLRPYLSGEDYQQLSELCDPLSPAFALHRPDFHFLQTFTTITGEVS